MDDKSQALCKYRLENSLETLEETMLQYEYAEYIVNEVKKYLSSISS